MSPIEKAEQLVQKYGVWCYNNYINNYDKAKELAIIAVDKIIESHQSYVVEEDAIHPKTEYWQQVKQEIEKL